MTFQPGLDSLVRIFNSHEAADVRDAALKSIAAVGTDEACEFLLDVLRSNVGNLGELRTDVVSWMGREQSLSLTLPPLGGIVLGWDGAT